MKRVKVIGCLMQVKSIRPRITFAGTSHERDMGDKWIMLGGIGGDYGAVEVAVHRDDAPSFELSSMWRIELRRLAMMKPGEPSHPYETEDVPDDWSDVPVTTEA